MNTAHARFGRQLLLRSYASGLLLAIPFFVVFVLAERLLFSAGAPFSPSVVIAGLLFSVLTALAYQILGLDQRTRSDGVIAFAVKCSVLGLVAVPLAHGAIALLPHADEYAAQAGVLGLAVACLTGAAVLRPAGLSGWLADTVAYRVLVLGTGPDAVQVRNALDARKNNGVKLVGFVPTKKSADVQVPAQMVLDADQPLEKLVSEHRIDEVVVAVREQRGGVLPLRDLLSCRLNGVIVTDLAGFFERVRGELPIENLKASWLIYGDGFRQGRMRRLVKRVFDVVAALMLLVVAAPVMLITALAILLEGGGPVIYRQERVGLGGKTFIVLKFRSMRNDAEKDGKARWAQRNDPRVTRVGAFIRKCRIDELPQLFNVLKGDMSFVGPRPERPQFVEQLTKEIPFYGARHSVKPGITGWAQVRFTYGASLEDAIKKLQYDLYYVKNHNLFLDLGILVATVRVVLRGEGAH